MTFILDYILTFNRMITPYLLTAVYWFFALILLITALKAPEALLVFGIIGHNTDIPMPVVSVLSFFIGLGILRIIFEMMILVFKMYDIMHKIAERELPREASRTEPVGASRIPDRDQVRFSADDA